MIRTTMKSAVCAAMLLASAILYAQAAGATRVYATIDGTIQGTLKGDVNRPGMESKTEVLAYRYDVQSPMAAGTTRATRRQHGYVIITKALGPASPQLFQALVGNETLKSVAIDFVGTNPSTGQDYLTTQVRLTNAKVVGIDHVGESADSDAVAGSAKHAAGAGGTRILEKVTFSFATIEITSHESKISATDSIAAP